MQRVEDRGTEPRLVRGILDILIESTSLMEKCALAFCEIQSLLKAFRPYTWILSTKIPSHNGVVPSS